MQAEHTLADGTRVRLRKLRADDGPALRETFRALSPESRFLRFLSATTDLSEAAIRHLLNVDDRNHVAIVAVQETLDLKSERIVGVARFVRLPESPEVAEIALTVIDEMHNRGLGVLLLRELRDVALAVSVKHFRAEVHATNAPILHLLQRIGVEARETGDGTVTFDAPLERMSDGEHPSFFEELTSAATNALVRALRRLAPPSGPTLPMSAPPTSEDLP